MTVRWISHRGLQKKYTENTLKAFEAAKESGFQSFETDVRPTADGHLILSHDRSLARLGFDVNVEASTRTRLERIHFGCGERPAFLEDVIDFLPHDWTLDIKPPSTVKTLEALKMIVEKKGLKTWIRERVRFLAWSYFDEKRIEAAFPGAQFYARQWECQMAGLAAGLGLPFAPPLYSKKVYSLIPKFWGLSLFRKATVDRYRAAGVRTLAFLPAAEAEVALALEAGFDEILTNGEIPKKA